MPSLFSKLTSKPSPPAKLLWEEDWRDLSSWICVDAGGGFGNNELQYCASTRRLVSSDCLNIGAQTRLRMLGQSANSSSSPLVLIRDSIHRPNCFVGDRWAEKAATWKYRRSVFRRCKGASSPSPLVEETDRKKPMAGTLGAADQRHREPPRRQGAAACLPAPCKLPRAQVWPDGGEIDILECFGAKPDTIQAAHWRVHSLSNPMRSLSRRGTYEPQDAHCHHTHTCSLSHLPRKPHRIGLAFSGYSLTWYVDGRPTTSVTAPSPPFSSLALFSPIINLAMGGTLTQHVAPADGEYEMRIGRVALYEDPPGGWQAFGEAHKRAQRAT